MKNRRRDSVRRLLRKQRRERIRRTSLVSPEQRRRSGGDRGDDVVCPRRSGLRLLLPLLVVFVENDIIGDVTSPILNGNDGFRCGVCQGRARVEEVCGEEVVLKTRHGDRWSWFNWNHNKILMNFGYGILERKTAKFESRFLSSGEVCEATYIE